MTLRGQLALLAVLPLIEGCGQLPLGQQPGGEAASSIRSPSVAPSPPSPPSPLPTPTATNPRLAPGDCVAAPAGARTQPMANDQVSFQVPPGWTDTSQNAGPSETLLLQLSAPPDYGTDA